MDGIFLRAFELSIVAYRCGNGVRVQFSYHSFVSGFTILHWSPAAILARPILGVFILFS